MSLQNNVAASRPPKVTCLDIRHHVDSRKPAHRPLTTREVFKPGFWLCWLE